MDKGRIYGLDIIRAFAIIEVVLSHGKHYLLGHVNDDIYSFFLIDTVTVFFVLSGFLIGGILIKTINTTDFGWDDLKTFWIRRWFRTVPNYFLILSFLAAYQIFKMNNHPKGIWQYFTFTQNITILKPDVFAFYPEGWSLSIEEWFYFFIPLSFFFSFILLRKLNRRIIIVGTIAACIISVTTFRIIRAYKYGYVDLEFWNFNYRTPILMRLDSLMYGLLGAYILYYHKTIWGKYKTFNFLTGIFILFILRLFINIDYVLYLRLTLEPIATLLILPKMYSIISGSGVIYKCTVFISKISYSMYLVNFTLMFKIIMPGLFNRLSFNYTDGATSAYITYALYWVIIIIISYLLYRFFEIPMMNLRDRFSKRKPTIPIHSSPLPVADTSEKNQ